MSSDVLGEMFILLLLILFSPVISRFLRIPVIVVEILLGIMLGPSGLGVLSESEWFSAMALMGFIYLMFVVGLEVEVSLLKASFLKVLVISLGAFLTPLFMGYLVALWYGLPQDIIAVALSTTSMGIILPTVREFPGRKEVAQVLLGAAILVDIISMFALAYVVEKGFLSPGKLLLLLVSLASFLVAVVVLKSWEPTKERIRELVGAYHLDVRTSIALIFGFSVLAEVIGVHAILGSFFAGLLVSEVQEKIEGLMDKLLSFGYGFFIPLFFIAVGVRTNLALILGNIKAIEILLALLLAGFLGKVLGTYVFSRISGFRAFESLSMGFAMSARLSLIIAAAELGLATGILSVEIYSMLVLLAIISVLLSPILAKMAIGKSVVRVPTENPIP